MKKLSYALVFFALIVNLPLYGCGIGGLLTATNWPKKRVMIMNAHDLTGLGLNRAAETVSEGLAEHLKKTGFFYVFRNTTEQPPFFEPGEPIPTELLRHANDMGMNAIIFETINPMEITPTTSGLWPFRKKARMFRVSINLDIVDARRRTLLLSKEFAHSATVKGEGAEDENEGHPGGETEKRILLDQIQKVIKKAAETASNSLNHEIWTGTIVSIDAQQITVNAGEDVGLKPGVVLEVYAYGEPITSWKDQTYHLPGKKVGEIKTVRIESRHSIATPLNSSGFKAGQTVKIKD